ncbi:hypothetical protein BH10BDE1_BH10BDE1_20270 [soil metagenome]
MARGTLKRIKQNRAALAALFLSLLIHATAGVPLLQDYFNRTPKPDKSSPMVIDIVSTRKGAAPPAAKLNANLHAKSDILSGGFFSQHILKSASSDVSLPAETAHGVTTAGESREELFAGDPMKRVQEAAHGWSGATQYGNAMGLGFTLETLAYFDALYDRVNSLLVYPDDFARQRLTGRVRIEAELSKDGKLIRFISSTADDRLLQTYCFAVLMQILNQSLPKSAWLPYESANVAFDFDFRVRIPTEAPHYFAREVQKNRLGFGRQNEVDPWLNEKFNEIITHYIPPIIPIPGGFYIDLIAAYQYVNNLIEGTPTESAQRQARLEKMHDNLRSMIHRMGPTPTPRPTPES